jgi:hypothetical protein
MKVSQLVVPGDEEPVTPVSTPVATTATPTALPETGTQENIIVAATSVVAGLIAAISIAFKSALVRLF